MTNYPMPASLIKAGGFMSVEDIRNKRGVLICLDGPTDTGKTEFILSCPAPGAILAVDRNHEHTMKNTDPPPTRQRGHFFKDVKIPMQAMTHDQKIWADAFVAFRDKDLQPLLNDPGLRTVAIDGDAETWELQRLATFGKLKGVDPLQYDGPNAVRKAMIAKMCDSGKVVVCTSKVGPAYEDKINPETGAPELSSKGNVIRVKSETEFDIRGFPDRDYLFHIWLRMMNRKKKILGDVIKAGPFKGERLESESNEYEFGFRIMKCKPRMSLIGMEVWGPEKCHFGGLMSMVYPQIPVEEWGL